MVAPNPSPDSNTPLAAPAPPSSASAVLPKITVAHDAALLLRLFDLNEDFAALAVEAGPALKMTVLDLYAWATRPDIAAYIAFHRTHRDYLIRQECIAQLQAIAKSSPDPTERRRAGTTILRALTWSSSGWSGSPNRTASPSSPAPRLNLQHPKSPRPSDPAAPGDNGHAPHQRASPFPRITNAERHVTGHAANNGLAANGYARNERGSNERTPDECPDGRPNDADSPERSSPSTAHSESPDLPACTPAIALAELQALLTSRPRSRVSTLLAHLAPAANLFGNDIPADHAEALATHAIILEAAADIIYLSPRHEVAVPGANPALDSHWQLQHNAPVKTPRDVDFFLHLTRPHPTAPWQVTSLQPILETG